MQNKHYVCSKPYFNFFFVILLCNVFLSKLLCHYGQKDQNMLLNGMFSPPYSQYEALRWLEHSLGSIMVRFYKPFFGKLQTKKTCMHPYIAFYNRILTKEPQKNQFLFDEAKATLSTFLISSIYGKISKKNMGTLIFFPPSNVLDKFV